MNETKINTFIREINYIKGERYRENIKKLISYLPDYFFEIPASSTGKYHPRYALGEGGLVRHTKVAVRIAYELLQDESIGYQFKPEEKDIILMALLLHDGLKCGIEKERYTRFDHPLLVCEMIESHQNDLTLTEHEIKALTNMISTHMGPWTKDYQGNEILKKPSNKYQRFVHMCDFLASKKFLEVPFDKNEIIG